MNVDPIPTEDSDPARSLPEMPTVSTIMAHPVPSIDPNMGMDFAIRTMIDAKVTCLAVISRDNRVVGMLSRSQARAAMAEAFGEPPKVKSAMTTYVYKVGSEVKLDLAAKLMLDQGISTLPIIDEGELKGVITATDILAELIDRFGSLPAPPPGQDMRERKNNKE